MTNDNRKDVSGSVENERDRSIISSSSRSISTVVKHISNNSLAILKKTNEPPSEIQSLPSQSEQETYSPKEKTEGRNYTRTKTNKKLRNEPSKSIRALTFLISVILLGYALVKTFQTFEPTDAEIWAFVILFAAMGSIVIPYIIGILSSSAKENGFVGLMALCGIATSGIVFITTGLESYALGMALCAFGVFLVSAPFRPWKNDEYILGWMAFIIIGSALLIYAAIIDSGSLLARIIVTIGVIAVPAGFAELLALGVNSKLVPIALAAIGIGVSYVLWYEGFDIMYIYSTSYLIIAILIGGSIELEEQSNRTA